MLQTKELTQNTVFKRQHAALLCHHLHRLWVIHNSMNCAWALRRQIHDLQLLNADMWAAYCNDDQAKYTCMAMGTTDKTCHTKTMIGSSYMGDRGLPLALLFALSSIAMALLLAGTVSCMTTIMTTCGWSHRLWHKGVEYLCVWDKPYMDFQDSFWTIANPRMRRQCFQASSGYSTRTRRNQDISDIGNLHIYICKKVNSMPALT